MYIASPLLSIISNTFITTIFTSNSYGSLPKLSSPVTSLITRTPVSKFIPFTINCGSKYWLKFNCQDYAGSIKIYCRIYWKELYTRTGVRITNNGLKCISLAGCTSIQWRGCNHSASCFESTSASFSALSEISPWTPYTVLYKIANKTFPIIIYNKLVTKQNICT